MSRTAVVTVVTLSCLLVAGCLGGTLPEAAGPTIEERQLPDRPATLDDASVLEYAVEYEAVHLHNRILREGDPSAIAAIDTCAYPAEDPRDGALDYWIERRVDDEFYLTLRCPVSIDDRGPEQSGSGRIGKWTTYAVTPTSTSRVELGNDVVGVRNRTVNFDDEPHAVTVAVSRATGASPDPDTTKTYDLAGNSYSRIRAIAPAEGTYDVRVRIDGGEPTSFQVSASDGENVLDRVGIYVSSDGSLVVDRRTETYLRS